MINNDFVAIVSRIMLGVLQFVAFCFIYTYKRLQETVFSYLKIMILHLRFKLKISPASKKIFKIVLKVFIIIIINYKVIVGWEDQQGQMGLPLHEDKEEMRSEWGNEKCSESSKSVHISTDGKRRDTAAPSSKKQTHIEGFWFVITAWRLRGTGSCSDKVWGVTGACEDVSGMTDVTIK